MKEFLRKILLRIPLNLNQNITYDRQAGKILKKTTHQASDCIDIGCHKGEFLDLFLHQCPHGKHHGFEPIPYFYKQLQKNYGHRSSIHPICLSDKQGEISFHLVKTNPAYSGILQRKFDRPNEEVAIIKVPADTLDHIMEPYSGKIDFIKIDVEGAEYKVLQGAINTIKEHRPVIVFEFGIGAADIYGLTPATMYTFFSNLNYHIGLMSDFLKTGKPLSSEKFEDQFTHNKNYYFVAWPD